MIREERENPFAVVEVQKDRAVKGILKNFTTVIAICILVAVIGIYFTDIKFDTALDFVDMSLSVAVMFFCTYSEYLLMFRKGTDDSKKEEVYKIAVQEFEKIKSEVVESGKLCLIDEFCAEFVRQELITARKHALQVVGVSETDFYSTLIGKSRRTLIKSQKYTKLQIDGILQASRMKPIKLTRSMILTMSGQKTARRSPIGASAISNEAKDKGFALLRIATTTAITGMIALELTINFSWLAVLQCFLKLIPIFINMFKGYTSGVDNVLSVEVTNLNEKSNVLKQFYREVCEKQE